LRRIPRLIIVFAIISLYAIHLVQGISSSSDVGNPSISLERHVQVNQWGATIVDDKITFTNKGGVDIGLFSYGFPRRYLEDLKFVKAVGFEGTILTYRLEEDGGYAWITCILERPLKPGETYKLNVTQVFSDRIRFQENRFNFSFFDAPTFRVQADSYNVTFYFPSDATLLLPENFTFTETKYMGFPAITALYKPLAPYSSREFSMRYSSVSTELVKVYWAKREIALTSTGILEISDSYYVRNNGVLLSALTIDVAKGAENIIAYDEGGRIWLNPQKGERMTVTPRYGTLKSNETFMFTLKYRVPSTNYIERTSWWGEYNLNMNIITPQRWIIDRLEVEVTLPRGAEVEHLNREPYRIVNDLYETKVILDYSGVTPLNDLALKIDYRIHPLWISLRHLEWTIIIGASIASLSAMARRRMEKKEEEEEELVKAPKEVLRRFVSLQGEKVTLNMELDEMAKKLVKGGISKKEYKRKLRAVEERLLQIDRSLSGVKNELRSIHTRYSELIDAVEGGEAEITAVRASIRQLYSQYRSGKISKETFNKISAELEKRMSKARGGLERILMTLREEAR
jgi:predicted  nucleic acid-binding Zn-ribbon protein